MKIIHLLFAFIIITATASAQTAVQVAKELVKQGVPHAQIVLAQARLETGNFTSRRCREDNNLFGMKNGRRYAKYKNWRDSIADYKKRISSRYEGGDYFDFLHRIGYATDQKYTVKLKNIIKSSKNSKK